MGEVVPFRPRSTFKRQELVPPSTRRLANFGVPDIDRLAQIAADRARFRAWILLWSVIPRGAQAECIVDGQRTYVTRDQADTRADGVRPSMNHQDAAYLERFTRTPNKHWREVTRREAFGD
jgi:hypothetical protein